MQRDDPSDYIYDCGVCRLGTSCVVIIVRGTMHRVKLQATTLVAAMENEKNEETQIYRTTLAG